MPIFNLTAPDGSVYEVDAPDENTARADLQGFLAEQPQTAAASTRSDASHSSRSGNGSTYYARSGAQPPAQPAVAPEQFDPAAEAQAARQLMGEGAFGSASLGARTGIPFFR